MAYGTLLLVDTDEIYLNPLEQSLIDSFGGSMEINVITDQAYLGEFFSTPREISLLLIHESLFNDSWARQNIAHVLLLSENPPDSGDNARISRVYKYSSVKEIVQKVKTMLAGDKGAVDEQKKDGHIVLFSSANGGTGKSTIARGLSAQLARIGNRTLLIALDGLQTLGTCIHNPEPLSEHAETSMLSGNPYAYESIKPEIRNELFDYIPPFRHALPSLQIHVKDIIHLIRCIKSSKDYEQIIIDGPGDFTSDSASLMNEADSVILVTRQDKNSKNSIKRLLDNISIQDGKDFRILVNLFKADETNAFLEGEELPVQVSEYIECLEVKGGLIDTDTISSNKGIESLAYKIS